MVPPLLALPSNLLGRPQTGLQQVRMDTPMIHRDDLPDTPDWVCTGRDWDERNCCPTSCAGICEPTIPNNIILGGQAD